MGFDIWIDRRLRRIIWIDEDWCDADTMALGIILFMYELPVGRRQNQRICRFLFMFRKAPVLESDLSHGICSKRAEYQY